MEIKNEIKINYADNPNIKHKVQQEDRLTDCARAQYSARILFARALLTLNRETRHLDNSGEKDAVNTLRSALIKAKNAFFEGSYTQKADYKIALDNFKKQCDTAIAKAKPAFEKHRGWHKLQSCEKMILGVFAILTIIPAVIVALVADSGIKEIGRASCRERV